MELQVRDLRFDSSSGGFGLSLARELVVEILRLCTAADKRETGGVLIGQYDRNGGCAHVTAVTGPSNDARAGRTWFQRGTAGLQPMLDEAWHARHHFYLGEWHFHPFSGAAPSVLDLRQMASIACDAAYHCPEPVLLIIGGNPSASWCATAQVFPRGSVPVLLGRFASTAGRTGAGRTR